MFSESVMIGEHLILFEDSMSAERALYDSGFVTGSFGSSYTDRKRIIFMDRVKRVIHCDRAYKMGLNGKNITVAVMDTGIAPHLDFDQRILHFEDFCQKKLAAYDDNGHGTHVAGIIGGSGLMSKDKRGVRLLSGVAPGVRLVVLKVLDRKGNGVTSHVLEGMDWLLKTGRNIR